MARPFKPGFDPRRNTKGRSKSVDLTDLIRRVACEKISPSEKTLRITQIVRNTFIEAQGGDMDAVKIIFDRGWGKAVQPIEQTGEMKITTRNMTDAELALEISSLEQKIKDLERGEEEAPGLEGEADPQPA